MNYENVSFQREETCCGCEACSQSCPQKCISMKENDRGFLVPHVNLDECISCGRCVSVCPEIGNVNKQDIIEAYAAITKDHDILMHSTSGGVFSVLCNYVLEQKGIVYGCTMDSDLKTHHIRVASLDELRRIQQSKYVQSSIGDSFTKVKKDLKDGNTVLFSGTGCQIAGLISFLGRKYDNLLTVEVACHGVPSPGLFIRYIRWKEQKIGNPIVSVQFRNKGNASHKKGEHYKFKLNLQNGKEVYVYSLEDPFYGAFMQAKTLRKTCYNCRYKSEERVADITLSDYWGIEREHKDFPSEYGASAVMIFTVNGKQLFDRIRDKLILEETDMARIIRHNDSLIHSAKNGNSVDLSYQDLSDDELFNLLKPEFSLKRRIRDLIPEELKYYIKKRF